MRVAALVAWRLLSDFKRRFGVADRDADEMRLLAGD
jgi:hypothetical protein